MDKCLSRHLFWGGCFLNSVNPCLLDCIWQSLFSWFRLSNAQANRYTFTLFEKKQCLLKHVYALNIMFKVMNMYTYIHVCIHVCMCCKLKVMLNLKIIKSCWIKELLGFFLTFCFLFLQILGNGLGLFKTLDWWG